MLFLLLSILSSTTIALIFKIRDRLNIPLLPVIVINYLAATALGYGLSDIDISLEEIGESEWLFSGINFCIFKFGEKTVILSIL
jgi:hypothetical protein